MPHRLLLSPWFVSHTHADTEEISSSGEIPVYICNFVLVENMGLGFDGEPRKQSPTVDTITLSLDRQAVFVYSQLS